MADIYQFLDERRTTEKPTHNSMSHPLGKFMIQGADADAFMDMYCAHSPDTRFGLLESTAVLNVLPVLVDADIKEEVKEKPNGRLKCLYEKDFVLRLVSVYQHVLRSILDDGIQEEDLLCVVMEKPPYFLENEKTGRMYIKNGFHLHFPRCFLSKQDQRNVLIPRIKIEWKKRYTVSATQTFLSIDNVIDDAYCKGTGWLLYRSAKNSSMDPYLISFVVDHDGIVSENWSNYLLEYTLKKKEETIPLDWDNIDYYLPRIFSISPEGKEHYIYSIKPELRTTSSSTQQQQLQKKMKKWEGEETEIKMVAELLDLLKDKRAEERNDWMMVGWALYNIFNGTEEGFNEWVRFSQRSPSNFDLRVCQHEWNHMKESNMTIGSLKYMAKQDSPEAYGEIVKKYMSPHIEKAMKLNGSHNDLARALFEKYEFQYVCASIKEKIWYEFADHSWNRIDEGWSLRSKISTDIVKSFEVMMQQLSSRCAEADEESQPLINKKLKNCIKLVSSLKQAPYKNNIMKECMEVFYCPTFFKEMDSNPYLFTFKNGVYDLQKHHFRDGLPSDKNTIKAPICYNPHLKMDHPRVREVMDFFEKIFPDKSVREYFLDISAQVFIGGNHAKIVQVWTGEGDNGKSVTQQLFEKMLGSFSVKLPTSLIVGKRTQSSAACPELVRAGNGVRMAMLQEPDASDTINVGILKELSGNDSFFARGLYKEGSEITPMFKLVLICNDQPKLPHNDKAVWNRIRVIPFESTFSDNAPEDPDEQLKEKVFPKDNTLGDRIGSMAEAFAWFLMEHLKQHPKIRPEPPRVLEATERYRKRNDVYRQFMEDHIVKDEGQIVSVQNMFNFFKEWHKDCVPSAIPPALSVFKENMSKIIGEPVQGHWINIRMQTVQAPPPIMFPDQETKINDFSDDDDDDDDF